MRIAYCGYDFFKDCLAQIVADGHELVELFSWPTDNEYDFNDNVFRIAGEAGAKISLSPMNADDLVRLRDKNVDVIVSAAYPYKIPNWDGYVRYAINVHPSALPEGRGPWPLPWLILKDRPEGGVTVHEIASSLDAGDILAQERFPLGPRETLESLSLRSQIVAKGMIGPILNNIEQLSRVKRSQGPGSYWKMPQKADRTILWTMTTLEIDRIVRAFSKFEPFVYLDGVRHFARGIDSWPESHTFELGECVHNSNRELVYAVRDGFVCLTHYVRADEK